MFPNVETMFRSDIETMKGFCALAQPEHLVMLKEVCSMYEVHQHIRSMYVFLPMMVVFVYAVVVTEMHAQCLEPAVARCPAESGTTDTLW